MDEFHRLFYDLGRDGGTWNATTWLGTYVLKNPLDLFVYQQILSEVRPGLVVETGTADGGSALFLAHVLDLLGSGEVVTVDVVRRSGRPEHPRITYLQGSSSDLHVVEEVRERAAAASPVMVILDSDHSREHVLDELRLYGPLVTPGSYLVVEDTNISGHPVRPDVPPGPTEALEVFRAEHPDFEVDRDREYLLVTFNPEGFLRKREA